MLLKGGERLPDKKITDKDYLCLSTMLKARESRMLSREGLERLLELGNFGEAARALADNGYEDMSGMSADSIDAALARRRTEELNEIAGMVPEKEVVDIFRAKYDYHNAKVAIKSEGTGTDAGYLYSGSGRISPEKIRAALTEDDYRFLPQILGEAMKQAKSELSRTGNPQLADIVLDKAYFAELQKMAEKPQNGFLKEYVRLLIDSANLRTAVRMVRMGKGQELLRTMLIPGGSVDAGRLAQNAEPGDGLAGIFAASMLRKAGELGGEAMKGGRMTDFELACDNAVTAFLRKAKTVGFGAEVVAGYLGAVENEITAVRMILTGLLAGISPERLKERLRETYA